MIRPKNLTDDFLVSFTRKPETQIKHTHANPQKTFQLKQNHKEHSNSSLPNEKGTFFIGTIY